MEVIKGTLQEQFPPARDFHSSMMGNDYRPHQLLGYIIDRKSIWNTTFPANIASPLSETLKWVKI